MANPLQIASKSQLITEKARLIFTEIMNQYQQGIIKTELELQYKTYTALDDFFTQLGKPTMQYRPAWGPPVSEDYNQTMNEVYNDLTTIFAECKAMVKALDESFAQVEIERLQLTGELSLIQDKLKTIDLRLQQQRTEAVFRDSFIDKKFLDADMVDGVVAEVNTKEGVLSLSKIEAEEYRDGVKVTIIEGNGYPGNTHQVRALSGTYKFFGQDNLHFDLASIVDGNSDTWLEYEIFEVSDDVKAQMSGYGFNYKEGMKWIKDNPGKLSLYMEIELPVAKTINWLSVSPFLPSDKGTTPAVLRSLVIQDGKGSANEVSNGYHILREDEVFIFPRQRCKKITVRFEQETAYETEVGHFFFKELESDTINYMAKDKEQAGRRIDGPQPSIENLGFLYDPNTRTVIQPSRVNGEPLVGEENIKAALFEVPKVNGQVQAGLEAITAKRYVIGIRDVNISSYRFSTESTYISTSYQTKDPIKFISLETNVMIPQQFGEGEWIQYFISIDEGKTWNPIAPRGTSKTGAKVQYSINNNVPLEGRFDNVGYIDMLQPVYNVRLKIVLSRPADIRDADFYTPIVNEYKLRCLTAKE